MVAKRCKYFPTFSSNGLKLALFTLIWICSPHLNAIDDEDDEDSCKNLPQHPRSPVSLKLKSSKPLNLPLSYASLCYMSRPLSHYTPVKS